MAGAALVFSNFVDDGAVFYLNGQELQRVRMPPGHVSYSTFAIGTPPSGDAVNPDVFVIAGDLLANLHAGSNLLAVEVHQVSATSSDIVFGSALSGIVSNSSVLIVSQPQSQIVTAGTSAMVSVTAIGEPPLSYQWRKDGTNLVESGRISGATTAVLTITDLEPGDEGLYSAVVSNAADSATSVEAALAVGVPVEVFGLAKDWKFDQVHNLDKTNWWAPSYDDSAWPAGPGVLAFENNPILTPLIRTTLNLGRTTYYLNPA